MNAAGAQVFHLYIHIIKWWFY